MYTKEFMLKKIDECLHGSTYCKCGLDGGINEGIALVSLFAAIGSSSGDDRLGLSGLGLSSMTNRIVEMLSFADETLRDAKEFIETAELRPNQEGRG